MNLAICEENINAVPPATRRAILAGIATAPALALPAAAGSTKATEDLIEAVMKTVVPYRAGYVAVNAERLKALCDVSGIEWAEHRACRKST